MANIGQALSFEDDGPVIENKSNLVYANALNLTTGGTGIFDYNIGADSRSTYDSGNSDFSAFTLSGTVGTSAISGQSVTLSSESATQAVFNVAFSYAANPLTPLVLTNATGTLTFDKVAGTYTLDLAAPISSFTVLTTSGTVSKESFDLVPGGASQPEIVVSKLADSFYVRFTGGEEVGGAPVDFKTSSGDQAFTNGETFVGAQTWVSISGGANGVASDTLQDGEVLDMNFYLASPGGALNPGAGTATTNGLFMKLDGLTAGEDFVIILKLVDPTNPLNTTTRAIVVDYGDIYLSSESNPYGITFADGSDGVVIIESNDYNGAGENWVINGAQLIVSTEGNSGAGIDLNRLTGASGGSSTANTEIFTTAGADNTDDNDVIKIVDIGFVSSNTNTQDANLDFSFAIVDADGDTTENQTLHVTIEGGTTFVGTAGADVMQGSGGNDILVYDPADFPGTANTVYDGGAGSDTLRFDGAGQSLDLTALAQTKIQNIENIDLTGTGNNTLSLSLQDVLDLSSTSNQVVVLGNVGDVVNSTGQGWVQGANQVIGPQTYASYTNGLATLLVDIDVTRNVT